MVPCVAAVASPQSMEAENPLGSTSVAMAIKVATGTLTSGTVAAAQTGIPVTRKAGGSARTSTVNVDASPGAGTFCEVTRTVSATGPGGVSELKWMVN